MNIDPTTLTPKQIRRAVINQGKALGSFGYYIADEIQRIERDPSRLRVYETDSGELRAYYDMERSA